MTFRRLALALALTAPLAAQHEATPQRPSFTTDTATTAPGTIELEIGAVRSTGFFGLQNAIKIAPAGRTEFSVGFDGLSRENGRTRFGDRIGLGVRRALIRREKFSFAVAPQAVFLLRGGDGARLGATAIAAYELERNAIIANFAWSTATDSSPANPAQQYDVILGYGRGFGRASVFAEYLQEFPNGGESRVSLMQGVSYRLRPSFVVDFAVQQSGVSDGDLDVGLLAGFTVNLGSVGLW